MGKLRVGIVVESLHRHGGVERRTSELARGLMAADHEVHIFANYWEPKAAPGAIFHYVPMLKFGRAVKPFSFAWFFANLHSVAKIDIIHTQTRVFRYDVATLGVGCHKAYLHALRITPETAPDKWFHRSILYIERCMLLPEKFRAGNYVITNSYMCKNELISYYGVPEENLRVVYNGVDHEIFSPGIRNKLRPKIREGLGLTDDDVCVLFVGTGFRRKGLDTLVEALRLLGNSSIKLVVVGRAGRNELATLSLDRNFPGRILWAGVSGSEDIVRYYAAADIFALPTRYDPFANSTMEALASGLPVITTFTNGVSEILDNGNSAFIIPPDDARILADCLAELVDNPSTRDRLGKAGASTVESFTWQRTTKETITVYEAFLAGKNEL